MSLEGFINEQATHAPDHFRTRKFLRLQRQWYKKLAASGFVDDELVKASAYDTRALREVERGGSRGEYYRLLGWWLHDRVWPSRLQKRVFELHADAVSYRELVARLGPMRVSVNTAFAYVKAEVEALRARYLGRS